MDLNLLVVAGRLAVRPDIRSFDSGARCARLLVTTRRDAPVRRVDVIPVSCWDPDSRVADLDAGARVWVAGSLQRRFWESDTGRRSRLEVVADHLTFPVPDRHPPGG